jgi:hypothetical protein
VRGALPNDTLQLEHPPTEYYASNYEGKAAERAVPTNRRARRLPAATAAADAAPQIAAH